MSILPFKPREKREPRTRGRHRYSPTAAEAAIRQAEGERDDARRRAGEFEAAYYAERDRARRHEAAYWQLEKLVTEQASNEIEHITVPPMVRDTTDPAAQATAPHGVRTVDGPAEVMPLAEAARRGHFGAGGDTMPLRIASQPGQGEGTGEVA
ncbi:hypothetical protein [Streptomyces sp. 184]|uniref:hypothetical protein n=1 Tax=Streptomyces sp. 184 TaxID=1827526 RepID=UPI0038929986